jgi:hypothetical protein
VAQELECESPDLWTTFEVSTKGLDPDLNTFGSDPWGSESYVGLRVPQGGTSGTAGLGSQRWMFLLCAATFQANEDVELVSARQLVTIGYAPSTGGDNPSTPLIEIPVESPTWRFQNGGNVSWHIIRMPPTQFSNYSANISHAAQSEAYQWSQTPALLSQEFNVDGYVPPWNAVPPSLVPVANDLLNFYDIRFPWTRRLNRTDIGARFNGPGMIAFVATVRQPNTDLGDLPIIPEAQLPYVAKEDAFVSTATTRSAVQYQRIAGAMTFRRRLKTSPYTVDDPCRTCGGRGFQKNGSGLYTPGGHGSDHGPSSGGHGSDHGPGGSSGSGNDHPPTPYPGGGGTSPAPSGGSKS